MGYLVGIDLGTSSAKVLINDIQGKKIALWQVEYDIDIPIYSWAEQDPNVWMESVTTAVKSAINKAGINPEEIKGIGFSGQMHGLVALDKEYKVIRPAIIWADQRTQKEVDEIYEIIGEDRVKELTLNPIATGFLVSSLYWMKKHEPEDFSRIHKVMLPKDYIRFKLTGEIGTDFSDASGTLIFSVKERTWCKEMTEKLGFDADWFPTCYESCKVAGQVTKEAAEKTGFTPGTPVVFGGADQPMQAIGNAAIKQGYVSCNIGTASQLSTPLKQPIFDPAFRTQTFCHAGDNLWFIQGATLNGGSALKWFKQKVVEESSYDVMTDRAKNIAPGSDGLIFLPYLSGERTPHLDSYARGVFFGLGLGHDKRHMTKAIMEGVVYSLRDSLVIFEALGIKTDALIASGGGEKSKLWLQIQADIFNKPVYTTDVTEEACLGAAIVAGVGVGVYESIEKACDRLIKFNQQVTEPIAQNVSVYNEKYEIFRELYQINKDVFKKL